MEKRGAGVPLESMDEDAGSYLETGPGDDLLFCGVRKVIEVSAIT